MKKFYLILLCIVLLGVAIPSTALAERGDMNFAEYYTKECPEKGLLTTIHSDRTRDIRVWIPYGYNERQKYDVILLMHGTGGSIDDWLDTEYQPFSANKGTMSGADLMDWMVYEKKCRPIIVATIESNIKTTMSDFEDEIIDIFAVIGENYSTYAEGSSKEDVKNARNHLMLGGLSTGGLYTCKFIIDRFEYVANYAILSGAASPSKVRESLKGRNRKISNLFIGCGRYDKYDYIIRDCEACHSFLKAYSENIEYKQYPFGHDFRTWHSSLYDICTTYYSWEACSMHAKIAKLFNSIRSAAFNAN